jgi:hypothetical protein
MKRAIRLAAAAVALAGGMAVTNGCQNSHRADTTDRPMNATAAYDRAYVATRDTEWLSAPSSTTRNRLPRGTRAYFATEPGSAEWQQARVEGQGVVWVRPVDFVREAR